jgi:hypothetical protein
MPLSASQTINTLTFLRSVDVQHFVPRNGVSKIAAVILRAFEASHVEVMVSY